MVKNTWRITGVLKELFSLHGERNRIQYHICMVIGCALLFLLSFLMVEIDKTYVPNFIMEYNLSASSIVDFIDFVLLLLVFATLWFLVCNKAKRISDMGYKRSWALYIEALRYSIIINWLLQVVRMKQEFSASAALEMSDIEFVVIFVVPIVIGIYKGKGRHFV